MSSEVHYFTLEEHFLKQNTELIVIFREILTFSCFSAKNTSKYTEFLDSTKVPHM